jgi:hypothetical protein
MGFQTWETVHLPLVIVAADFVQYLEMLMMKGLGSAGVETWKKRLVAKPATNSQAMRRK